MKSLMISRAVVRECMSGLASFSNWRVRNQPFFLRELDAPSLTMPMPRSAAGVSTTLAPRKRISLRRSTLNGLRHGDDQRIALRGAHHRKPDAGVAAGRLDHGLAGLELARLLRRLDHAEREAILHRAERIERLDLDVEVHVRRARAG